MLMAVEERPEQKINNKRPSSRHTSLEIDDACRVQLHPLLMAMACNPLV